MMSRELSVPTNAVLQLSGTCRTPRCFRLVAISVIPESSVTAGQRVSITLTTRMA